MSGNDMKASVGFTPLRAEGSSGLVWACVVGVCGRLRASGLFESTLGLELGLVVALVVSATGELGSFAALF